MATLKSIKNKYLTVSDGTVLGVTTNTDNISALSFKLATADSLSKFNLVDGFADDYNDATGVDATASSGEYRDSSGKYYSGNGSTTTTYSYTGSEQSLTVPSGVTSIYMAVWGAGGNDGGNSGIGGGGGAAKGDLTVVASDVLKIVVGQSQSTTGQQAYGGGGESGAMGPGGGYSGVFTTSVAFANAVLIGGGGGGGAYGGVRGAAGGGTSGEAGQGSGNNGGGGTQGAGGAGPGNATAGSALQGGNGTTSAPGNGSGGGGGYYGGGGGDQGATDGGGGGGSGYIGGLTANGVMVSGSATTGGGQAYTGYPGSNIGNGNNHGGAYFSYGVIGNMTLQSNVFTAQADPTTARIILDELTSEGNTVLDTDLKAYASRDNGTTFTQMPLANQGYLNPNSGIDGYTKLMLHMDGSNSGTTFTDSSFDPHTVTASGSAVTSTAQKKFGTASGYFPAAGDFLTIPDSADWAFGSDPFTIDCWLYRTGASSYQSILEHKTDGSNYWQWRYFGGSGNFDFTVVGTGAFSVNWTVAAFAQDTWVHHQIVRNGTSWYLFQNGTQVGSTQTQAAAVPDMTGDLYVTGDAALSQPFVGYIDELRISKGIARNTSNFVVPWGEYVNSRRLLSGSVDISGQPAGSNMKYKIETLNQAEAKQTRVYGTSMAWA